MFRIQNITNDPKQKQTLVLPDGSFFEFSIYFSQMQLGWFIRELSYGDFVLNGARIVTNPNMLHQYRNQIPFGLFCFSSESRDPQLIDDFSSGACELYVLTEEEVQEYAEYLSGQV